MNKKFNAELRIAQKYQQQFTTAHTELVRATKKAVLFAQSVSEAVTIAKICSTVNLPDICHAACAKAVELLETSADDYDDLIKVIICCNGVIKGTETHKYQTEEIIRKTKIIVSQTNDLNEIWNIVCKFSEYSSDYRSEVRKIIHLEKFGRSKVIS